MHKTCVDMGVAGGYATSSIIIIPPLGLLQLSLLCTRFAHVFTVLLLIS